MGYIVAVDIGGTKIAAGVLNKDNVWLSEIKRKSDTSSAENMYTSLLESIQEAIDEANVTKELISGLGITIPGQLDTETGLAIYQNNLPWENFPLGAKLAKDFPTYRLAFEHDVTAAALGEWSVRNLTKETFVYLTVSTGICASIIHQGKPLRGLGLGGEIGFFPVNEDHNLETFASGSAMNRELKSGNRNLSLEEAFKCWEQGDHDLNSFFQERAYQLAVAIFNMTAVLDPDKIVLGGGVINNQASFFTLIKEHYQSLCKHPLQQNWTDRIEISELKGKSGIFGVAMKVSASI